MKPKSSTLFHFTKSIDYLKSILSEGLEPRYCLEDSRYLGHGQDHIGSPMVCFCDIPISRLSDHTSFYGDYGIGLTKNWGLKNKVEPIIYSTDTGAVPDVIKYLLSIVEFDDKEKDDLLNRNFNRLIPRVKPLEGRMVVGGEFIEKDFYQESEWRFVPDDFHMAFEDKDEFQEKLDEYNDLVKQHTLKFTPSDIIH